MPQINPAVLVWARESAGLTVAKAAKSLALGGAKSTPEAALLQYEQGAKAVSRALLKKMAATYRRPLLVFYLPQPPAAAERGEGFRVVPEEIRIESKGSLDALVRDIYVRKQIIKDLLADIEEAQPKRFVNSLDTALSTQDAATRLSELISFDIAVFRKCPKPEDAFSYLRKRVEGIGVFVLLVGNLGSHHTNIPVEAFRGFALADEVAPIIVINDQDAPAARSFTLLHELAHILLGATGLSGSKAEASIERYCNDIASLILMPAGEIEAVAWPVDDDKVVGRHKVGGALIELVNRSLREGALTVTKASKVLGVKPGNVYNVVGI